jgi:hypothetical protein
MLENTSRTLASNLSAHAKADPWRESLTCRKRKKSDGATRSLRKIIATLQAHFDEKADALRIVWLWMEEVQRAGE